MVGYVMNINGCDTSSHVEIREKRHVILHTVDPNDHRTIQPSNQPVIQSTQLID